MTSAVELLFSVTTRVSVLIALAWGAARLLRGRSAALRHLIWSSAAIGALVLAAAAPFAPTVETTLLPVWQNCTLQISPVHIELPMCGADDRARGPAWTPPADRDRAESSAPAGSRTDGARSSGSEPAAGAGASGRTARDAGGQAEGVMPAAVSGIFGGASPSPWTLVVGIWAAGALAVLLMVLLERLSVRRLTRSSREARGHGLLAEARELARELDLRDEIDLRLSPTADSPLSWGLWRPRIVLPANAEEWPEDDRKAALLHELGHARRRDVFTQTLAAVSCALLWFHPLVWLAATRMRDERERACDELVLQAGMRSTSYARSLVRLAREVSPDARPRIALVGMTERFDLADRVDRLVSGAAARQPPGRATTFVSVLAALALTGVLAPHVIAQPDCPGRGDAGRLAQSRSVVEPHQSSFGGDPLAGFAELTARPAVESSPASDRMSHLPSAV